MFPLLPNFLKSPEDVHGFKQELRDLTRGVAGGMIFGTPVIYTMEVWAEGQLFSPALLLVITFFIVNINICFSYFAGLREKNSAERFVYAVDDGITSFGLSMLLSFAILWLINRLDFNEHFRISLAKVLLEASFISVGVTFTNFKFKKTVQDSVARNLIDSNPFESSSEKQAKKDLNDLMAAVAGSILYSFNVASTEEIVLIAASLSPLKLFFLFVAELLMCFVVLYASGIRMHVIYDKGNFFQHPVNETLLTASISFVVSALLLTTVGYGNINFTDPLFVPNLIVLGLPAVIGGAAGRLAV